MRKLIKSILPEVGVEDLKIRPRDDNRCESANIEAHLDHLLWLLHFYGTMYDGVMSTYSSIRNIH